MVIFRQTQGPMSGIMSGRKGPVIPFLLRNKEAGKVKVNINFIKIIISLNKVKKEVKALRKVISFFI